MKERIKNIRKDARLTQEEFGSMLGVSRIAVTTYETGRVIPDKSVRLLICSKFGVNEAWLENGEGDPYREELPYRMNLIPELSNALSKMPAVCSALERILPVLTDDDLDRINEIADLISEKFGK